MKHVWLPTLGVWAQAHEIENESITADSTTRFASSSAERKEDSAKATACSNGPGNLLCTGMGDCHRHDEQLRSPDDHGDGNFHSYYHRRNGDKRHFHHDHQSGQDECQHHKVVDGCHHHRHGYCNSCNDLHYTCPICLSSISQSDVIVLRWCMHRFCLTCIEKWSSLQRFCPLCKQTFHGYYYNIQSTSVFDRKDLAVKSSSQSFGQQRAQGRRERYPVPRPPVFKRPPWRRTLRTKRDHLKSAAEIEGDEQALKWRSSIYKKGLRAVPFDLNSRVKVNQASVSDPQSKARIERRLEPWIRRELRSITGEWDHSLLVQLVLSLWLHCLSEREQVSQYGSSRQQHNRVPHTGGGDVESIRQLEPFLQEKVSAFWHELRCFAESPYSLRAYDSVVMYEKCRS